MILSRRALRVIPLTILLVICLCLLVTVTRQAMHAALEANIARRVQAGEAIGVRPWMTIPYISRTYGVPEDTLYAAIGLTKSSPHSHAPLQVLARREGQDLASYTTALNALIDHARPPGSDRPAPRRATP